MLEKTACRILVGETKGKRPLGRQMKVEDNIRMYLTYGVLWTGLI
jgi:hypothetical protein